MTFHNRFSCSSSHSFRNPLYEVHVLSLVNNQTEEKSDSALCGNELVPPSQGSLLGLFCLPLPRLPLLAPNAINTSKAT